MLSPRLASELKAENEAKLFAEGVAVNAHLPELTVDGLRPVPELLARGAVLHALSEAGEGAPPSLVRKWLTKNGLSSHLCAEEVAVLASDQPLSALDRDGLLWRREGAYTLAWIVQRVEGFSFEHFAPPSLRGVWPDLRRGEPFVEANARARALVEIARQADLAMRLHWAIIDAAYTGSEFPAERYHPDLVVERRRVLQWALSPGTPFDTVDLSV